jgi:fructokinase
MPDVICYGELLIDFVPTISPVSLIEAPAFKKAPGGAPANVAVGLARLGIETGFMGKVGEDAFGRFLAGTLAENNVDISALVFSDMARTALAFVSLGEGGEREFMFYRHPSADMLYTPEEVNLAYIQSAKIFHFGSISLISEPSRSASFHAIRSAKKFGLLLSYDPNLRLNLWDDKSHAREGIMSAWSLADIIKVSEEEIVFLSGQSDISKGAAQLWHPDLKLLVITRGKSGCRYVTPGFQGDVDGYAVDPVDTTGAGDGFVAGLLKGMIENPMIWEREDMLAQVCRYANAVGALATLERGAIPALPSISQVTAFINAHSVRPSAELDRSSR